MRRLWAELDAFQQSLGGRRRASLNPEAGRFRTPWVHASIDVRILVVSLLLAASAQELGRPVAASVVCRVLARLAQGRTLQPKSGPEIRNWPETDQGTRR